MMARNSIEVGVRLANAWLVQPGDKLVLAFTDRVDMQTMDTIMRRVADKLPGVEAVIVDRVSSVTVYRPEHSVLPQTGEFRPEDCCKDADTCDRYVNCPFTAEVKP